MTTVLPPVPHRTSSTVLGLLVPCALLTTAAVAITSFAGRLPERVAVRWVTGEPRGTGPLWAFLVVTLGVPALVALGCWAAAYLAGWAAVVRRVLVGVSAGVATGFGVVAVGALAVQVDLRAGADAPEIDGVIVLALALGVVAGAVCSLLAPGRARQPARTAIPADAARIPLTGSTRAAWSRSVTARGWVPALGLVCLVLVALAVALRRVDLLLPVLVVGVLGGLSVVRVTVDERGLVVRAALGWPRVRVPLTEVERARVVAVRPFTELADSGLRRGGGGRTGVVLRAGDGIEVQCTGGRSYVVSVDDAATAAALLNSLADRRR